MQGVFLHVLADSLGSLGVIISTVLVKYYGLTIADPVCSFIIATMILASSIPFIKMTAKQLLLEASPKMKERCSRARQIIYEIEGVIDVGMQCLEVKQNQS